MAPVLVREVRFRTQSGPGSWDGELERVMGVTGISIYSSRARTSIGSVRHFLSYSCFAMIFLIPTKWPQDRIGGGVVC